MQDPSLHQQIGPLFPEHEQMNCPRCDSSNTKFCYYNNYNLSQPRHYCKNCRRYWTKGGTIRNIPVGGGIRKSTKRASSSSKQNCKSQTLDENQSVDQDHRIPKENSNEFGKDLILGLGSGSESNVQSGDKAERLLGIAESDGECGKGSHDLEIYTPGSIFQSEKSNDGTKSLLGK